MLYCGQRTNLLRCKICLLHRGRPHAPRAVCGPPSQQDQQPARYRKQRHLSRLNRLSLSRVQLPWAMTMAMTMPWSMAMTIFDIWGMAMSSKNLCVYIRVTLKYQISITITINLASWRRVKAKAGVTFLVIFFNRVDTAVFVDYLATKFLL